ncbi:hypothetical protein [Thermophagus xiamenensis]|uniref:Uncharacterized protein n=1 Tax=Thermophagus xiamenensis TaxID=385682 RepID=A0A1I1VJF7_9BACT|nr:hypothetical protein [Thermophagus xiamenensis]SFD80620.1 hypothetical protein SAMN05444380_102122 [Thermophagus xiamenensis]
MESTENCIVYPNPVNDFLFVKGIKNQANYVLLGIDGAVIKTGKLN